MSAGPRIVYPAAAIRGSQTADEARRGLDFLRGAAAARLFERAGFAVTASR